MKTSILFALLLTPAIGYSAPSPLQNAACTNVNLAVSFALTQYNQAFHGSIPLTFADSTVISRNNALFVPYVFAEIYINSPNELTEITTNVGKLIFSKKLKQKDFHRYAVTISDKCEALKPLSAQVTSNKHDYSKQ